MSTRNGSSRHVVVVVGGGFGGLAAVRRLRSLPVDVTLIDRNSFHLFQPLTYQVATGVLSPDEIATPLRRVTRRARNVEVVLGAVTAFDAARRRVIVEGTPDDCGSRAIAYDSLIVAAGATYTYFGHDGWRALAHEIKSLDGALQVRRRMATALEAAEHECDLERREAWLTFVVVGAGPTGVELAGQIGELARATLRRDYRRIDTARARILLLELGDRVLAAFPPRLSERAGRALEALGVTLLLGTRMVDVAPDAIVAEDASGERRRIQTRTVIWAAGVVGADAAAALSAATGAPLDHDGRIAVGPDLTIAHHPEIFAIGDMASVHDASGAALGLPGLAPVAMQEGRYAARVLRSRLRGDPAPPPFTYHDKGMLATIGRAKAVARIGRLPLSGLPAWVVWLLVHLFSLVGLQNRLVVLVRWAFSYFTRGGGVRLVASGPLSPIERSTECPSPSDDAMSHHGPRSRTGIPSASSSSSTSAWTS